MTDLAVDALAAFRLTRLIVSDAILDEPRGRLLIRLEQTGHPKLAYLIGCPWCVSPYVAVGVVAARRLLPRPWGAAARVLAFSAIAGIAHAVSAES